MSCVGWGRSLDLAPQEIYTRGLLGPGQGLRYSRGISGILLEIIRRVEDMKKTLRGRPSLNIPLERIIEAVRRHGQVVAAAGELRCSDGYIHKRFRQAGITLAEVLECHSLEALLRR